MQLIGANEMSLAVVLTEMSRIPALSGEPCLLFCETGNLDCSSPVPWQPFSRGWWRSLPPRNRSQPTVYPDLFSIDTAAFDGAEYRLAEREFLPKSPTASNRLSPFELWLTYSAGMSITSRGTSGNNGARLRKLFRVRGTERRSGLRHVKVRPRVLRIRASQGRVEPTRRSQTEPQGGRRCVRAPRGRSCWRRAKLENARAVSEGAARMHPDHVRCHSLQPSFPSAKILKSTRRTCPADESSGQLVGREYLRTLAKVSGLPTALETGPGNVSAEEYPFS